MTYEEVKSIFGLESKVVIQSDIDEGNKTLGWNGKTKEPLLSLRLQTIKLLRFNNMVLLNNNHFRS